jgi:cell wall-associated NlpC family hydrolase
MPRGQRFFALPLIAALISSGLLAGSAGTSTAAIGSSAPAVGNSSAATTVSATTALQRKKQRRVSKIRRAVRVGINQIGDPYVYGADGPDAFDCSGFTSFAYGRANMNLTRTSHGQAGDVRRISKRNVKRGDLIFFYGSGGVYHVAMFLRWKDGERIILHSPSSGKSVNRDPIWTSSWFAGTKRIRG